MTLDRDGQVREFGVAWTRRNCFSASSIPAAVQRIAISPLDQFFTFRADRRMHSIIDSHGFVDSIVCFSFPVIPSLIAVSVSSIPSRSDAAAPAWDARVRWRACGAGPAPGRGWSAPMRRSNGIGGYGHRRACSSRTTRSGWLLVNK